MYIDVRKSISKRNLQAAKLVIITINPFFKSDPKGALEKKNWPKLEFCHQALFRSVLKNHKNPSCLFDNNVI